MAMEGRSQRYLSTGQEGIKDDCLGPSSQFPTFHGSISPMPFGERLVACGACAFGACGAWAFLDWGFSDQKFENFRF